MSITPTTVDVRFEIRVAQGGEGWTRAAYDAIYSGEGIDQIGSFYRWILRVLAPRPGARLLDVACGAGALPNIARERHGLEAYGSDLSAAGLQLGRRAGAAGFVAGNGEGLPFAAGSFDYVTCLGSLEHFLDMGAGVREMARVLRPDGLALILVPNSFSLTNNIYSALRHGRTAVDSQPLQRYAARLEWAALLEANGLRVERTVKYERAVPDNLEDMAWYARHWRTAVWMMLTPIIPLNLANCFVYLCRRDGGAGQ